MMYYYNLHPQVVAFSTTRRTGFSIGAYAHFNINPYCGDDPEAVRQNRNLLCQQLHISDDHLILPHQVHQARTAQIDNTFFALSAPERQAHLEATDAVMTDLAGVCIGVSTADCIPILIYDPTHHAVAAVHAGWRGTVQRIVRQTIASMTAAYGTQPSDLLVQIGPGISLDNFEVGDEVYDAFASAGFDMQPISRREDKWHIDLPQCNPLQLIDAGVQPANIALADICTVKHYDTFFSARRLGINSGRIYTAILIL